VPRPARRIYLLDRRFFGAAAAADGTTLVDASYGQPVKQATTTNAAGSKAASPNELYLVNSTKAKLNVELSEKPDSRWKTHSLDKGAALTDAKLRYIRIGTLVAQRTG
jgi:hypothetical protein